MVDLAITEIINLVTQPKSIIMVHNNVAVKAVDNTVPIYIGNATHVDLLINLGAKTGTAGITYHIAVIESVSGKTVRTYDGTALSASDATDTISVDGLVLGDWIKVTWTTAAALSNDHYFSGVTAKLVVK